MNSETYFSRFWRPRSPRSRHWQIQCLVTALFLDRSWLSFHWVPRGRGARESSGVSVTRAPVPCVMKTPSSLPRYLPEASPPTLPHWGPRFQPMNVGGHAFSSRTVYGNSIGKLYSSAPKLPLKVQCGLGPLWPDFPGSGDFSHTITASLCHVPSPTAHRVRNHLSSAHSSSSCP